MKTSRLYFLIIVLSILPLLPFFTTALLPHTHDGLVHLPRQAAYYKALTDGQIPVRWAGDLNYGYGMPLFNFIYQIPYIIGSFFLFIGFSLVNSFKLSLTLSYVLSGIFMLLFTRAFFNDNKKAFLVTVFYQFATFRFVELVLRGSFGEVYTYTFFPLVLYGLVQLKRKITIFYSLLSAYAVALLVLSHNALSLTFFAISVLFVLFFYSNKKTLFVSLSSLFFGLLLASFYWIPALLDHKYTYGNLFMKDLYLSHFPPIQNFLIPNFTNSKILQTEGISVQIGIFHVIGIFLGIFLLRKKIDTNIKNAILFSLALLGISLFFMQPLSKFIWEHISMLRQFQFPWRFLGVIVFASAFVSTSYLSYNIFKKKLWYLLIIFLVIVVSIPYWRPSLGYDRINEAYYWNFPLNTTYYGETDVIWSAGPAKKYPKQPVEIIDGKGKITDFKKGSDHQTFTFHADTASKIVSHTQYFPGWRAYVDTTEVPIQFQDANWRGEIIISIPQGHHNVTIAFTETKIRFLANMISLFSVIISILILLVSLKIYVKTK